MVEKAIEINVADTVRELLGVQTHSMHGAWARVRVYGLVLGTSQTSLSLSSALDHSRFRGAASASLLPPQNRANIFEFFARRPIACAHTSARHRKRFSFSTQRAAKTTQIVSKPFMCMSKSCMYFIVYEWYMIWPAYAHCTGRAVVGAVVGAWQSAATSSLPNT